MKDVEQHWKESLVEVLYEGRMRRLYLIRPYPVLQWEGQWIVEARLLAVNGKPVPERNIRLSMFRIIKWRRASSDKVREDLAGQNRTGDIKNQGDGESRLPLQ